MRFYRWFNQDMSDQLSALRARINEIDKTLVDTLSRRKEVIIKIGELKKIAGVVPLDASRWQEVLDTRIAWAKDAGLEEALVKKIFDEIHEWSLDIQKK